MIIMSEKKMQLPASYKAIEAEEMMYLDGGITIDKDNFWPALLNGLSITVTIGWKGSAVDDAFGISAGIKGNDTLQRLVKAIFNTLTMNYTIKLT
jgi:hypothetical protein